MFLHLKKNNILIIFLLAFFFSIISLTYIFFFKDSYKEKPLVSLKEFSFDTVKYNEFKKNLSINLVDKKNLPLIAHAGGGYKNLTYTNSIDALNFNKERYELFELDFFLTKDNKLVCSHDWSENLNKFENFEFYVKENKNFKPCTYKSLKIWLKKNPNKKIVTDFKNDNLAGLKFISEYFDNYQDQFIPQIYLPNEYKKTLELGYKDIIWTLYRFKESNKKVIKYASRMNLYALAMPKHRAQTKLPQYLKKINIKSYVHTINSLEEYFIYLNHFKVDQIYTDWIN